jgi:hypothetical protein
LNLNNGTTRFSMSSGTSTIGAGSTLELGGSVPGLSSAVNRVNITTAVTTNGVLVSGSNHRVGQINGAGSVVVNSGSDLTADRVVQSALVIQASAGSPALVTIDAGDSSGNHFVSRSAGLAAPNSTGFDVVSSSVQSGQLDGVGIGLDPGGNSASQNVGVPEPSSFVMLALAGNGTITLRWTRQRSSSGMAPIRALR